MNAEVKQKNSDEPHFLAVDIGSGYTSVMRVPTGTQASLNLDAMHNSVKGFKTAVGLADGMGMVSPGHEPLVIEFPDKERYFVGQTAEVMLAPEKRTNTLSPDWAFERGYLALLFYCIATALMESGVKPNEGEVDLVLTTGLPQRDYADHAKRHIAALQQHHVFRFRGEQWNVNIVKVIEVPQAMGAGFMASQAGVLTPEEAMERVGIIDIGTFTTDYCLTEGMKYRAFESGGSAIGISELQKELRSVLERKLSCQFSPEVIDRALQTHTVIRSGERLDISNDVSEVINQIGMRILKDIKWDIETLYVILVGGGAQAHLFGDWFKSKVKHIRLVTRQPYHAIVIGYAIYAMSRRSSLSYD